MKRITFKQYNWKLIYWINEYSDSNKNIDKIVKDSTRNDSQ